MKRAGQVKRVKRALSIVVAVALAWAAVALQGAHWSYERAYGPEDDFVVLVDPDGNRFCVVAKPDGGSM